MERRVKRKERSREEVDGRVKETREAEERNARIQRGKEDKEREREKGEKKN